jgi:hypothetical protein
MTTKKDLVFTSFNHPLNTILRSDYEQQFEAIDLVKKTRTIGTPSTFDGRRVWKKYISKPMDQGNCGSCWAWASVGCLGDRFNLQSKGQLHVTLSPAKVLLCDMLGDEIRFYKHELDLKGALQSNLNIYQKSACFGNTLFDAFRYLYVVGTCEEKCVPYNSKIRNYQPIGSFTSHEELPPCFQATGPLGDMCSDWWSNEKTGRYGGTPQRFFRAHHIYRIAGTPQDGGGEDIIRHNIFGWGPVATGFRVYSDFYTFDAKKDIYRWNGEGDQTGGHAVVITGWGEDWTPNGPVKWWQIRNSWGEDWGDGGYFRMLRGSNECGIDENCMAAVPDYFYPLNTHFLNPKHFTRVSDVEYSETDKMIENRRIIAESFLTIGGGIDPETGLSRRILSKRSTNVQPPINWRNLPDFRTFVAGRLGGDDGGKLFCMFVVTVCLVIALWMWFRSRSK